MKFWFPGLIAAGVLSACTPGTEQEVREPEAATGFSEKTAATANKYMVAAANKHAVEAGYHVLEKGGSAVDAAVAVQSMLGLVEPQSSGIGGGAFILYWDNNENKLYTIDARETAPQAATEELFLDDKGNPPKWIEAVVGGRSVGTPGVLRGLELAHERWGKSDWSSLFSETVELAEAGFEVSPRLAKLVEMEINPGVKKMPAASSYFFPNGNALKAGDTLKNSEYAKSLSLIAEQGADAFYEGELAEKIVKAVQNSTIEPGVLSLEDLSQYSAKLREPVCNDYREYQVCGMGPPSSGGITTLQTLGVLENFELGKLKPNSEEFVHWFTQASRLAYADRNQWIADPDFVEIPVEAMLDKAYLSSRAETIKKDDMGKAKPGVQLQPAYEQDIAYELPNTSHISIVDGEGNVVSMTTSIEMGFGSTVMAGGFLLNNQLTDFSLAPGDGKEKFANRVVPGKRPRSSMAPTVVLDKEGQQLIHAIGSPGGSRIINYVTQTLVGMLDWNLNVQEAINLGHVTNRNDYTSLEKGRDISELKAALEKRKHDVRVIDLNSGLHGITINSDGTLVGGADPRREGVAKGE
ncbi:MULTISPECIES: gamma-glutamyltransferase [Idiomarina]|jgi:gamma-glutamyltranspeptidase/glutathione hydrolase|uniref:gamma-glutamyltransferase n=1 Tax=Idiomarina TaxID=135575 RepID=UPI000C42A1B6|nr:MULTISPECIES: gamma-glutamyltransferase [Idiomarina]MAO68109.1 gamma-glutamyltransferase [Idiomarina sp.]MBF79861.1 gamma-glutamyltransferase [Idiomarina sp.]|tara:strand:+ start:204 stop:1943 length:1740 start_codon:yes stop_codon:yes gene_type:complete